MEKFISNSMQETLNFAKQFASKLKSGDVVLLKGDLGAGKTVFAKGIVDFFSKGKYVAVSPTFVLVNSYEITPQINHFDLYRLKNIDELYNIGFEELLYSNSISLIEWPERAREIMPLSSISVIINKIDDEKREIVVEKYGKYFNN